MGELYQIVTSPVAHCPTQPQARTRTVRGTGDRASGDQGSIRLSLFNEVINDALISQTGPLANGRLRLGTYVQNVDSTRARGVEFAFQRSDLLPRIDLSGSVTYADATTRETRRYARRRSANRCPRSRAGKRPRLLLGARSDRRMTAAGRYSSRMYGTLDNSDVIGNTYQGSYKILVVDLRAQFAVGREPRSESASMTSTTTDASSSTHSHSRTFHADLVLRS